MKIVLQNVILQIGHKMFLLVKKNKSTVPLTYIISDLKSKEIAGISMKKIQMLNQLGVEKVTRKKGY